MKKCLLCDGLLKKKDNYLRCDMCEHEFFNGVPKESFIVNEKLDENKYKKSDWLDKYKQKLIINLDKKKSVLVDVGSASGKFINAIKNNYKRCYGVEITDECRSFSKKVLKLKVYDSVKKIKEKEISMVTFWHSLEHIPFGKSMDEIFFWIRKKSKKYTKVVISVPNCNFWLYKIFGSKYTYYDKSSHYHQFSIKSLKKILSEYGFKIERTYFSFPYSFFGYLQTCLNLFFPIHNFFYYSQKRGWLYFKSRSKSIFWFFLNIIMIIILMPISLLLTIIDFFNRNEAAVLNVSFLADEKYKKNKKNKN